LDKELFSGVKNDPILEWISPSHAKALLSHPNADIMSVGAGSPMASGAFTSAVIHASVNKTQLEKQAEKEKKAKEEEEKAAKA
jgi:hypothetical protein